ncbi:MAG: CoA-binding protein, partial [Planctomycetota bacterium]
MSREADAFHHIITQFLNADTFAVAGASARPHKYGFKVFDALINSGRRVFPINPTSDLIAG